MYDSLFSPLKIGSLTIRNRVIMAAMGCGTANRDGTVSERQIAYYTQRAQGGAGLIITGVTRVDDETGAMDANQISVSKDETIPSIQRLVRAVHAQGAAIFLQLHHPGNQTSPRALGGQPTVGPSGIKCQLSNAPCRAMTLEEIRRLVESFAQGALRAQKAGADGVELHCAHGYLLEQFLSPYTNRRTDEYGGCMENRARIVEEIIRAIREKVGRDYPVTMRISVDEFLETSVFPHDRPGLKLEEGVALCRYLAPFGLDGVNVSAGTYETMNTAWEPTSYEEGWKVYLAEAVKQAVDVPVFCVGSIRNPDYAERVLEEGRADAVCIARGQLADPEWCRKAAAGRKEEIRRCISCLYCMQELTTHGHEGRPFGCAINARAAHEIDYPVPAADGGGRKVVIVGGGPAGMEAARVLSLRGFHVVLLEEGPRLGGQLLLGAKPPRKEKLLWLVEYFETVLPRQGVEIRLNTRGDAAMIEAQRPYAVFDATGAAPVRPGGIPGIEGEHVALYTEVLKGEVVLKDKQVALIGSGMSGLETAALLAQSGNRLDIVEMAPSIGPGVSFQLRTDAQAHLKGYPVRYYPGHKLVGISNAGVALEHEGEAVTLPADWVVLALGVRGDGALTAALKKRLDRVTALGDAQHPGRIAEAVHSGFEAAYRLE